MKAKYPGVRNGQIEALINILGGMCGVARLLSGKTHVCWKVWRTVVLGIGPENPEETLANLKVAKVPIGDWVKSILKSSASRGGFSIKHSIDLVMLSVSDLGLPEYASTKMVYERAQELGLQICPTETAALLRLQYANQPRNEILHIGMRPVPVTHKRLGNDEWILVVECLDSGERVLYDAIANPESKWHSLHKWVFALP